MFFTVLPVHSHPPTPSHSKAFLVGDNWNDWFKFRTLFSLSVFDEHGTAFNLGGVKIGEFGLSGGRPNIPDKFDSLSARFFSLGQDENYYETLNKLDIRLREQVIEGLHDIAHDLDLFEKALNEEVTTSSLLRYIRRNTVRERFHGLATGTAKLTAFHFSYHFPARPDPGVPSPILTFDVEPRSLPPTNIHVLIGRNGVGKTRCLNRMTHSLFDPPASLDLGGFSAEGEDDSHFFSNLVSVTFSAFDPFEPLDDIVNDEHRSTLYSYIGLRRKSDPSGPRPPKTPGELAEDFVASVERCRSSARTTRWRRALRMLEADPLFKEADVSALSGSDVEDADSRDDLPSQARHIYNKLSSGHKIVLLTITRLIETVDERTLVLLDEPEAHLHPPLLSAFVRSLSDLLVQRNGVAIIATHSPVVLQEVPKACVWILRRSGEEIRAERPEIETFGENVGVLTREVFGLEVSQAGFHTLVQNAVERDCDYESILEKFGHSLGAEARALVRALVRARANENKREE